LAAAWEKKGAGGPPWLVFQNGSQSPTGLGWGSSDIELDPLLPDPKLLGVRWF